jgi:hypothetical protein
MDNYNSRLSEEYRGIMCAFRTHGVSMTHYPAVEAGRMFEPGTWLVILTEERGVFEGANDRMSRAGMPLALRGEEEIYADGVSYWVTFVEVRERHREGSGI